MSNVLLVLCSHTTLYIESTPSHLYNTLTSGHNHLNKWPTIGPPSDFDTIGSSVLYRPESFMGLEEKRERIL